MGFRVVLLVLSRSKRCRRSRSWRTSTRFMPRRFRSARQIKHRRDVEYAIGQKVLLSTRNPRSKLLRKLRMKGQFYIFN